MLRSLVNYIDESCMAFQSVLLCLLKLCAAETIMLSLCRAVCPNLHHRFSHAHRIALPMRVRHAARAHTITCYSLYGHFRPAPLSCLLAHWESPRLLSCRCVVQSHCRVIFFLKFCSDSVGFLSNFPLQYATYSV